MPDISTLDRRITINKYIFSQDSKGGNIKALTDTYIVWASIEQLSGSKTLDNAQVQYKEVYKIIKRYEGSRILSPDDEIVYENIILNIGSVKETSEGKKKYNEITAFANGKTTSGSTDIIYKVAQVVHYEGTGGERDFQDDDLKGYTLIIVFRDGVNYTFITSGTPVGKQALYNSTDGTIEFSAGINALTAGEIVDVYLLI